MKPLSCFRILACTAALAAALPGLAQAQANWPNKPVRVILPFAPGGSSDLVGRQVAQHLSSHYGQQFVAENRAGAGGNIGVDAVAKSAPDGYTVGIGTSGPLANNKSLYNPMPFDAEKDLTPIALVGEIPLVLAVNPSVKANTLAEFVALSKASANGLTVSNPGNGTIGHLATEYLSMQAGAKLQPVPYKGDSLAMVDAMSGSVNAVLVPVTSLIPNIQANKLRALAVTAKTRFPALPNVPTAIEQGVDLQATVWSAMVGPAGLPQSIVTSLNQEINKYTSSPEGKAKLNSLGMVPLAATPQELQKLMSTEAAKWQEVVKAARISVE
ncbi:Tripartite tricarboxylate transporter family receptor [Pigmentiphaga humi]|uniref:Tripartite tricarboxylate transporter family receptor n=1 Tax=Pigmentiphaga humi TaxID=2478468 RepID=A0A3P4B4Q3_9BURK|nr:tripartite tricarboxylate transporter substrate binding protein [Pigmentiphaga humi]VCU71032.1 Tripartite tricarboxylate transporter family receptor [Pigmentiphaga humi]